MRLLQNIVLLARQSHLLTGGREKRTSRNAEFPPFVESQRGEDGMIWEKLPESQARRRLTYRKTCRVFKAHVKFTAPPLPPKSQNVKKINQYFKWFKEGIFSIFAQIKYTFINYWTDLLWGASFKKGFPWLNIFKFILCNFPLFV